MQLDKAAAATAVPYCLGHADWELQRLQIQASIIGGITQQLIRDCGIKPGMRVIEVGCGAGDVSLLLAEAVGPTGSVLAIEREAKALEHARARAEAHPQIEFVQGSFDELDGVAPADAVFGRYVLCHQGDPVAMVRRASLLVRPGGVVAFHETALHIGGLMLPEVELFTRMQRFQHAVFKAALPHFDVAGRLVSVFQDAGLPSPEVTWKTICGDATSPIVRWWPLTARSLLPKAASLGIAPFDDGDIATLGERIAAMAAEVKAQVVSTPQACAWARRA
jgi:SAM-dependent methyltransferase